jgi:hypothetical protein
MKYIITESRLNDIIFKYLNNIDWEVEDYSDWDMTRLFFKGESQFPEHAIFESYNEQDVIDNEQGGHEIVKVLLINREFYNQIKNLFGLDHGESHSILISWYENYTNETIDDKSLGFID